MTERVTRREIVEIGRLMYDRRLIVATEGNLSIRLGGDHFLATPSGVCKGFLEEDEILLVSASGQPVQPLADGRRVTSEWRLHREIYATRSDVGAICHGHPPRATAFSVFGKALSGSLLPETLMTTGDIPLVSHAPAGSPELAVEAARLMGRSDAVLLARHGVVTVGVDLREAYYRLESVEHLAHVTLLSM